MAMVNWGFWCYSLLIGITHQVFGDLLMEIVVIRTPINIVHGSFISIIYEVYKPTYDCAHPVATWDRKYVGRNNWGCCLYWEFHRFGRSSNTLTVPGFC